MMESRRMDETLKEGIELTAVEGRLRQPMTILFSDITGSTSYFEEKGDVEGLRMIERHNRLLFPCIESNNGRIIKTIGDAILAVFVDPVDAVEAAVGMQHAVSEDNRRQDGTSELHVRIGVHSGLGLEQGDDVFGDVVNAASRVQGEAQPDQILITDTLLSAAKSSGYQIAKLGRAKLRGKHEPVDLYALGWSQLETQKLFDDLEERFEQRLEQERLAKASIEEKFDRARAEFSAERRRLNEEIDRLEEDAKFSLEAERVALRSEITKEAASSLKAAESECAQAKEALKDSQERFLAERAGFTAHIATLEERLVEAIARGNNPARDTAEIREQVQTRLVEAKREWESQWQAERQKLLEEIEETKSGGSKPSIDEARRLVMERVKAKQESRGVRSPIDQLQKEKERIETECDELRARVQNLESQLQHTKEQVRTDVYYDLHHTYDQKLEQAQRITDRLELEVQTLSEELAAERRSSLARIQQLEKALPEAVEAARSQAAAEAVSEQSSELFEAKRVATRAERRHREALEEWNLERDRLEKQAEELRANLVQALEQSSKRSSDPTIEELNQLRRQLEEEFRSKASVWEEEKQSLTETIENLRSDSRQLSTRGESSAT